ncbi:MAG TPA: 5-(carboxyamino)imidazole ribonucleotide synthase [Bacilli bacterium]|nr:5-(carboxyamino)imidazole ribonucleotide synthase [Bacilli bacterium]
MPTNNLVFGKTIGIIGGGQLGRMMATTARHMGYRLVVLDPTPNCPAAQLADEQIIANYDDFDAIKQLATLVDLVTYEFENVDLKTARYLEEQGLLPQGTVSLEVTQDRELEKQLMTKLNLPVAPFEIIKDPDDLKLAVEKIGFPAVVKTCRGGYDGKGQLILTSSADFTEAEVMLANNQRLIYEKLIQFDREVSIVFTRSQAGVIQYFPIAENEHREHILDKTIVPARITDSVASEIKQAAEVVATELDVVGTFAIEFFVAGEEIYLNELAPRPHNSGHFTIEACNVSQFEQHIRAICNLPLIPVLFHGGAVMVNLLGDNLQIYREKINQLETAHLHFYGKDQIKPKRKIGHLTFVAGDRDQLINELAERNLI